VAKINDLELTVPEFEFTKTNRTPEYLAKFPLGKIPSFESSDGLLLIESNAIAYYVAESGPKRDQLLGATPGTRGQIQQWIFFTELQLSPDLFELGRWRFGIGSYNKEKEDPCSVSAKKWLDFVEAGLKGKKWLVGDDEAAGPSLADITVAGTLFFGFLTYIDAEMRLEYPEIVRWYEQIKAIPVLTELFTGPMVEKRKEPPT
jgi:elongation factor 1-gamma